MRRLTVRANEQDGAISIMAAGLMLAMLLSTALAVDVGRVASVSRDQQGITDRAALDSVLQVSRSDAMTLEGLYPDVADAVIESMDRNPGSTSTAEQLEVVAIYLGTTANGQFEAFCGEGKPDPDPDPDGPPPPPLCTGAVDPDGSLRDSVNAVWVATESVVPFVFAIGAGTDDETGIVGQRVRKVSVAETLEVAGIMIGSELASVRAPDLQNSLNALICNERVAENLDDCNVDLGSDADVALASYKGLATVQVTFSDLVDELNLGVGSVTEVLQAEISAVDLLKATATVLGADGYEAEAAILNAIASEMSGNTAMTLGANDDDLPFLLDVVTTNGQAVLRSQVNVLRIVTAVLQVANHEHFVDLPDVSASIPGLAGSSVSARVISAPAQAFGPARQAGPGSWVTQAETAQVELAIQAALGSATIGDLADEIVGLLGSSITLGGTPTVDGGTVAVEVSAGSGVTRLTGITCRKDAPPTVDEFVTTGVVHVSVPASEVVRIDVPLRRLGINVGTLRVTVSVEEVVPEDEPDEPGQSITFSYEEHGDFPRGPEPVSGDGLGFGGPDGSEFPIKVSVDYIPAGGLLSLVLSTVTNAVLSATDDIVSRTTAAVQQRMVEVLQGLDENVIAPSLELVGAEAGSADVWATSADCAYRRLAPISLD